MPDEEWDGNERRTAIPMERKLDAVERALVHVAEGMESFVSSDEIDRRIAYEQRQRNKMFAIIGVGVLVAVLSTFVSIAQLRDLHNRSVRNRAANAAGAQLTISAVNCILYSLNEHRQANEFAHRTLAAGVHVPYNEPAELMPPASTEDLRQSCDVLRRFLAIPTTTTTVTTTTGRRAR